MLSRWCRARGSVSRGISTRTMMRFWIPVVACSLFGLACAGVSSMPLSGAALEEDAVFYVEHQSEDHRSLNLIIVGVLRSHGLIVSTGMAGGAPEDVDYIVTYEDRWGWDMRTYLREITIRVRRTESSVIVAMSESHQDSMSAMGESYEEIVAATAHNLFGED